MAVSITGTVDNSFAVHSRNEVTVTWQRLAGTEQLIGFSQDDDSITAEQTDPSTTYTPGLYGGISANIDPRKLGTITLKLKESSPDNAKIGTWHNELKAGRVDPATIIISSSNYRHTGLLCLPEKPGSPVPSSQEDPAIEWVILVGNLDLWIPINQNLVDVTLGVDLNLPSIPPFI